MFLNIAAVVGIRWLATAAHTGPGSLTLWVLAAVFFFVPSAIVVARLASRNPAEGGLYVWTRQAFGDWHGFLCGWCYWVSNLFYLPNLVVAGVAMAGRAIGAAENKLYIIGVSMLILWLCSGANLAGLSIGKWVSNIGGLATYAAGALIACLGLAIWWRWGSATPIQVIPELELDKLNFWSQIAFAFGGIELAAVMGGEIRDPRRVIPHAAWIAGLCIAAFYVLGTLAILVLIPAGQVSILSGLVQAGQAAGARLEMPWLGWLLVGLILGGVAGQLGAWLAGAARVPFVMGLDRHLPAAFARVHPRWRAPYISILIQAAVCTLALAVLQAGETLRASYQLLVDLTVISYFIPFLYLFAAGWKSGEKLCSACGMAVTAVAIVFSMVPPSDTASPWLFEAKVAGGAVLLIVTARLSFRNSGRR